MATSPKQLEILKTLARSAGAIGTFTVREIEHPELLYEYAENGDVTSAPLALYLGGKMLFIAVFEETDGKPAGIES